MTDLKITLIGNAAHHLPSQRKVVGTLGLSRINSSVVLPGSAATHGVLMKIAHLISVKEVNK